MLRRMKRISTIFRHISLNTLFLKGENDRVKVVEVAPRDGLQNIKQFVPTAKKVEFVNKLSQTGLSAIEVTSFVNPKFVPQLSDNVEVINKIHRVQNVRYIVLVPSLKNFEFAVKLNVKEISFPMTASNTYNRININCSTAQSLEQLREICKRAKKCDIQVRAYIGCAFGCPYEGVIKSGVVAQMAESMLEYGCSEICLGDTIGVGTPGCMLKLLHDVLLVAPAHVVNVHCHDTYGQALPNILCALQMGIRSFDSSVSSLGGCPFAPGATGNVATEDVLYMLHGLGMKTGVALKKLEQVSLWISEVLNKSQRPTLDYEKFAPETVYQSDKSS